MLLALQRDIFGFFWLSHGVRVCDVSILFYAMCSVLCPGFFVYLVISAADIDITVFLLGYLG